MTEMTDMNTHTHTVKDEWLAAYSAGTLSRAKRLLIDCQAEIKPSMRDTLYSGDRLGGALLETAPMSGLSSGFSAGLADKLTQAPATDVEPTVQPADPSPDWLPKALARFMEREKIALKWRFAGPGVQRARLVDAPSGERLYLLKARAGFSVPDHSHTGEEWTLLLTGGYHVGPDGFVAGDLHQEDETCRHSVRIDDDGPCISLVMDEGKIRFTDPIVKFLQPLFGI